MCVARGHRRAARTPSDRAGRPPCRRGRESGCSAGRPPTVSFRGAGAQRVRRDAADVDLDRCSGRRGRRAGITYRQLRLSAGQPPASTPHRRPRRRRRRAWRTLEECNGVGDRQLMNGHKHALLRIRNSRVRPTIGLHEDSIRAAPGQQPDDQTPPMGQPRRTAGRAPSCARLATGSDRSREP